MFKLNNKGFAITGILYSVLVLFLLVLVSMLSVLSSKKNRLFSITEDIRETVEQKNNIPINEYTKRESDQSSNPINTNVDNYYITNYRGKYEIIINNTTTCHSYLASNVLLRINNGELKYQLPDNEGKLDANNLDNLNKLTLIGNNCNNTGITTIKVNSIMTSTEEKD